MALSDYSATAASNTTIGGIDVSGTTGKVKDGDNVMRQIAADLKAGVITGYTTTATAAGTTTLTVASNSYQFFTGTTTQTVVMPVTSTLELGRTWVIVNNSTGALTVNSSGGDLIATVASGDVVKVQCILLTGTTAASWFYNSPRTITSSDAGATVGPTFELYRNSATPAADDVIGRVLFNGEDSAGNTQEYGAIRVKIVDPTSTSEDGAMLFSVAKAGAEQTNMLYLGASAAGTDTADVIGLPRGQLSFPASQNASSDANTLDDYEEGTWTPQLQFGGANVGMTTSLANGTYTKIGRLVTVRASITLTAKGSSTGAATISGLPFSAAVTTAAVVGQCALFTGLTGALLGLVSGTTFTFRQSNSSGNAGITETVFQDTTVIQIAATYEV